MTPSLAAQVTDTLLGEISPPPAPSDWLAASVDGSHIDVDRHLPVPCYLLNLGGCVLTYGAQPDAQFFSRPHLAAAPDELYLSDPERPTDEEQVTGNLLGLYRTVRELTRLAEVVTEVVRECPADLPTLALVDSTLVLWGLAGQGYRPFIRQFIINEGLLPALEQFRQLARERRVTLAAYVSLPRVTEVANAIRPLSLSQPTGPLPRVLQQPPLRPGALQQPPSVPGPGPVRGTAGAGPTLSPLPHQLLGAPGILRGTAAGLFLLSERRGGDCPGGGAPMGGPRTRTCCRWATA